MGWRAGLTGGGTLPKASPPRRSRQSTAADVHVLGCCGGRPLGYPALSVPLETAAQPMRMECARENPRPGYTVASTCGTLWLAAKLRRNSELWPAPDELSIGPARCGLPLSGRLIGATPDRSGRNAPWGVSASARQRFSSGHAARKYATMETKVAAAASSVKITPSQ